MNDINKFMGKIPIVVIDGIELEVPELTVEEALGDIVEAQKDPSKQGEITKKVILLRLQRAFPNSTIEQIGRLPSSFLGKLMVELQKQEEANATF